MVMKQVRLNKLMKDGKMLILAYDQGFEHGPVDFNSKNVDPNYILDIALEGRYTAVALQTGIAEKYYKGILRDIPLIIKLNGKTTFQKGEPCSLQHTSVKHAINLGALAVGYTIYLGSQHEQQMFVEFGKICEQAHEAGIPAILWMYPRGQSIQNDIDTTVLAYAARIALELGADVVKLKFNGDVEGMKWVVKCAGKTKVVIAGGEKTSDWDFLDLAHKSIEAGAIGLAIGRNVWQHKEPQKMTRALKKVVFENKTPEQVVHYLE